MSRIFNVTADYILSTSNKLLVDISALGNEERQVILKLIDCLKNKK